MKHQLALITGASSGIGSALAERLAQEGIRLILCGRDLRKLQEVKSKLKVETQLMVADLAQKEGRVLIAEIIRTQKPDLVVNNAGAGIYGAAVDLSIDYQTELVELNVVALQELSLIAARTMKEHRIKGTILNVSSSACFQVMPNFAVYSATKAYVTQFSQCLDFELAPFGIRVLTNCPGMVETNFRERAGGTKKDQKLSFMAMTADFAAEQLWKQIRDKKRVVVFDWKNRILIFLSKYLIPTAVSAKITQKMIDGLIKK